jgi:phenylpropionate dioxygenase-like ring-hydroxylating dioxygenase large terminal subunit
MAICVRIGRMGKDPDWHDLGAVAGACNHVGGPLGQGRLHGEHVVCPWHN